MDDCIASLHAAREAMGRDFTRREYDEWARKHGQPSSGIVKRHFRGLWNEAKASVGLLPLRNTKEKFTDDDILNALHRCAEEIGEYFTDAQYEQWQEKHLDMPGIFTIRRRFGNIPLNEVKKRYGLGVLKGPSWYVGDRWKDYIMRFIHHQLSYESYLIWCREHGGPDPVTILKHAGSYTEAILSVLPEYMSMKSKSPAYKD